MKCNKCGQLNSEEAKFCRYCGALLNEESEQTKENVRETQNSSENLEKEETGEKTVEWGTSFFDIVFEIMEGNKRFFEEPPHLHKEKDCSFCGSTDTQLIAQNTTDIKSNGYNWTSGCCGMCLLGPFGILCGMIGGGTKVKITNEAWWLCPDCGKKHIAQSSALEKADALMKGILGNSLIAGIAGAFIYAIMCQELSTVLAFLATIVFSIAVPAVLVSTNYKILYENLGYSIVELLSIEKRKEYTYFFIGAIVIIFLVSLLLGANMIE